MDSAPMQDSMAVDVVRHRDAMGMRDTMSPMDGGNIIGGPSRCSTAGVQLCENFEMGVPGAAAMPWSTTAAQGSTVMDDTTRAARGTHSMRINAGPFHGTAFLHESMTFPEANNTVWGRAFYYMVAPTPQAHATFFTVVGTMAGVNTVWRYGVRTGHLYANFYGPPAREMGVLSATAKPTGRWTCFEWEFKGDSHELHLYMDGNEITDVAVMNPVWAAPTWTQMSIGWQHYEQDDAGGYELWVDEVAVNDTRITCAR
jgi:hypothetical protein